MINKIKEDFNKVIAYSQGIPEPKTDKLFDIWRVSKDYFIRMFGGQYIYECPEKVQFELSEEAKHERVLSFINLVEECYSNFDLAKFIHKQEDGFFKNLTIDDYTTIDGKVIHKGTKLVKAFKYFVNNERSLTAIQNEASRIIQEDKVEGTLCFSVHPLDFLSVSENTYNWRSCHALDGEYRAGNLSYMMDQTTFICYLRADEPTKLPNFPNDVPWNSKKWRVLLYLSEDTHMIIAGRQYPFASPAGMNLVLEMLTDKIKLLPKYNNDYFYCSDCKWSNWHNCITEKIKLTGDFDLHLSKTYLPIGRGLEDICEVVYNQEGSKQFNDVLSSSFYKPIYAFQYFPNWDNTGGSPTTDINTTKFPIGGFTYCLWCGKEEVIECADTMMCADCELEHGSAENEAFATCDCCGHRYMFEEGEIINDEYVCSECIKKYCTVCEECGDLKFNEHIKYSEKYSKYLCVDCYDEIEEEE